MKKIFIVEDEAFVAIDLQETLQRLGYEVTGIFATAESALQKLQTVTPDLMLVDVSLSGEMSGVEMIQILRRDLDIPVIYITAYSDDATITAMKGTEPFEYILKPFNEQVLRVTIEFALHKAAALREQLASKRLLATTLQSIGDAVITTDELGIVRFINPVAEDLTGWSHDEAIGRHLDEVFPIINEQTREPAFNPVRAVLETGKSSNLANNTLLLSKDGTEYPIEDSAAPIEDEEKTIHGVVLVFRDVTKKQQAELWLRRAQKLDSLGLLAGGIAHDFNNILGAISVNGTLLRNSELQSSESLRLIDRILRAGRQAVELTDQLLTYAGGHPLNVEIVDLNDIINSTLELVSLSQSDSVEIKLELSSSPLPILAEPSQIQQVVLNLILNSLDAMSGNDRLGDLTILSQRVHIAPSEFGNYLSKKTLEAGSYARLIITDTGVGIDSNILDKIFDPFFSTKPTGRGLGLAATLGIIYQCDGGVRVESKVGEGTRFNVILPCHDSGLASEERQVKDPHAPARNHDSTHDEPTDQEGNDDKKYVLIADDHPGILETIDEIVTSQGFQTLLALDGTDAVEMYQKHSDTIAFVILDIRMPTMSGIDALKSMLEHNPVLKAILMTGHADASALEKNRQQLANVAILQKPFTYEALLEQIEK